MEFEKLHVLITDDKVQQSIDEPIKVKLVADVIGHSLL